MMAVAHEKVHRMTSEDDLWKDAFEKEVNGGGCIVQMTGLHSSDHTVFARVATGSEVTIGTVVESMVEEGWRNVARDILEKKQHIETNGTYPSATQLLELGSVWLCNETLWKQHKGAHAHRVAPSEESMVPNWEDMTLRVHFVPDRFHAANEFDFGKYCRGLLVDKTIEVQIGDEVPHVPVIEGLPDTKDGVIVYEDDKLGFAVINKPGNVPVHATRSNHREDAVSMFTYSLNEERNKGRKFHVSVPQRHDANLDMECQGLLTVSTSHEFTAYMMKQLDQNTMTRKFKCLVCVTDPERMGLLEHFQKSGKLVTHYFDHTAPAPIKFYRNKPNHPSRGDWQECKLRITKVGDEKFRAACVKSVYKDSIDCSLAHRLWGPDSDTPAEDLGVEYVMELELELITSRKQQIRGQLAALGFPLVGDTIYGGGACEFHSHKHKWNRVAIACSEVSFFEPMKEEDELVPSERRCVFRLKKAWWTEYLQQYEMYHTASTN